MQISIEEKEQCKLLVNYEAGPEEILNTRGKVLELFKKAPVPGNRTGKATMQTINHYYRDQIEDSLKKALAEEAFHNTLFEKKLKPHGPPKFNTLSLNNGKFTCEFELHTKPVFELANFKDLEIPKPHSTANAVETTEKLMQDLRIRFGEVVPYSETDFVQMGDNVIIDYEGSLNGEKVENLSAQGDLLTVGQSQLSAFDDNLLGMVIGDVREFDMAIPENGLPSVAGKTIQLKVTLNMGSKTVPCPLDDTLAKKAGKETFMELKEAVHGSAMAKIANDTRQALTEAVANKLVNDNQFEVPNWMSLSEAQYLVHTAKLNWDTMPDSDKERYIQLGARNVKLSLILDSVRDADLEAQLSDQEVFEIIKRNLANTKSKTPIDEIIQELSRTGYLQILFSRIKDENSLDRVVKLAKIIE
jgi:trigger factor